MLTPTSASLSDGPLLSLTSVSATLPGSRGAARLSPSTLTRWILRGCKTAHGKRVKLAATRCGHRWLTTAAAVSEFQAAMTAASLPDEDGKLAPRSPAATRRASEQAEKELKEMGM